MEAIHFAAAAECAHVRPRRALPAAGALATPEVLPLLHTRLNAFDGELRGAAWPPGAVQAHVFRGKVR